jgi:uncharacterized protein (DUF849 family)
MLQGCLNGNRTKLFSAAVPYTAAELARDAIAAVRAGASELHVHPRNAEGFESLEPADVAAALNAIRAAVPGVPVGVSTHWDIGPGGRQRQKPMSAWSILPNYVSVNLIEDDAPEMISRVLGKGIGVEAGLWSVSDAQRFVSLSSARSCLRVLLEINEQDDEEGRRVAGAISDVLGAAGITLPRLLHGLDSTKWSMFFEAIALGYDARIGFEDGKSLPNGHEARDNATLVEAGVQIIKSRRTGLTALRT